MIKSLLLALFVLVLGGVCAFAVRHFGRRAHEPEGKIRALFWLFLGGGAIAAVLVFAVDWRQRQTTLFEALLEGSVGVEAGAPVTVRVVDFFVESPGVEHRLYLQPKLAFAEEATGPVELTVVLAEVDGPTLVDDARSFGLEQTGTAPSGRTVSEGRTIWEGQVWRFTPESPGKHRLEVGIVHVGIHEVFARIEDPRKRDGRRAPGY